MLNKNALRSNETRGRVAGLDPWALTPFWVLSIFLVQEVTFSGSRCDWYDTGIENYVPWNSVPPPSNNNKSNLIKLKLK